MVTKKYHRMDFLVIQYTHIGGSKSNLKVGVKTHTLVFSCTLYTHFVNNNFLIIFKFDYCLINGSVAKKNDF